MPDPVDRFPFTTTLDLSPLVDFWSELAADPDSRWYTQARNVLERVESVPELNGPIDGAGRLEAHQSEVQHLMSAVMSPHNIEPTAAAMVPWSMAPVYLTESARRADLVARMREHFGRTYDAREMVVGLVMKAYGFILQEVYGFELAFELPFSWMSFRDLDSTIPIPSAESGITRRLSIDFDTRFVRVEVVGERPQLTENELAAFAGDPNSLKPR
jgi:hypothetical protein